MPEEKDNREDIIDKMREIARSVRSRNIEGFVLGVKYKDKNEDGQGGFVMAGDPVAEMAMAGKMMNIVLDQLFKQHRDDPKMVLCMFLDAMMQGQGIRGKTDDGEKAKTDDLLKDIKVDEDLRKKLDGDVPGLDDLLNGK